MSYGFIKAKGQRLPEFSTGLLKKIQEGRKDLGFGDVGAHRDWGCVWKLPPCFPQLKGRGQGLVPGRW